MQYSNYDMKNNVHATLSTAISSVATTIQLTAWQGARFWNTFPQIATLESFDENWKVVKREIVQITWRSGDNLTVVRAFAPCPENDDANSQSQNAISFNADDTISLYIPKEIFDIISQSMNDIYDNGTNNMRTDLVSWLQVEVNPWSVLVWSAYYDFAGWTITLTDNATNYLEIDEDWNLANNTTSRNDQNTKLAIITTFGGEVTNIKDWRLWTVGWRIWWVNIHDLTEKNVVNANDEFIISDSENIWNNKKIKYWTFSSNLLYNSDILSWEDLSDWDLILKYNIYNWNIIENSQDFWNTITKIAIKQISNWQAISSLWLYLKSLTWNTATWLTLNIESDNNWEPSWTALLTQDIIDNVKTPSIPLIFWTTDYSTNANLLSWAVTSVACVSKNWKYLFANSWQNIRVWKLTKPFVIYQRTDLFTQSVTIQGATSMNCIWNSRIIYVYNSQIYIYSFTESGISLLSQSSSISNCVSACMSEDWKHLYLSKQTWSSWNYTLTIEHYSLSSWFDLSTMTFVDDITLWTWISYYQPNISYTMYWIIVSTIEWNNYQTSLIKIKNDWTIDAINYSFNSYWWPGWRWLRYSFNFDWSYCYWTYRLNSSNSYVVPTQSLKILDEEMKERDIVLSTEQTITKGDTYRITLEIVWWSGDCFGLWYINQETDDFFISLFDSVWNNDNTKYPYIRNIWNNWQFFIKANIENNKLPMYICNWNIPQLTKTQYIFKWIVNKYTWLQIWEDYFVWNDWKISLSNDWYKIWKAVSSTWLLLDTKQIIEAPSVSISANQTWQTNTSQTFSFDSYWIFIAEIEWATLTSFSQKTWRILQDWVVIAQQNILTWYWTFTIPFIPWKQYQLQVYTSVNSSISLKLKYVYYF